MSNTSLGSYVLSGLSFIKKRQQVLKCSQNLGIVSFYAFTVLKQKHKKSLAKVNNVAEGATSIISSSQPWNSQLLSNYTDQLIALF